MKICIQDSPKTKKYVNISAIGKGFSFSLSISPQGGYDESNEEKIKIVITNKKKLNFYEEKSLFQEFY